MQIRIAVGLVLCACAATPHHRLTPPSDEDDPAARAALLGNALDGYHAEYVLAWNGARIGEAREKFHVAEEADGGYRFERVERVVLRRGDATETARTIIRIDTDQALQARHVVVDRLSGPARVRAEAVRMSDQGWRVTYGSEPARLIDGAAVPSTLVPLLVGANGASPGVAFRSPVLVEGVGLAEAQLTITVSPDRATATADLRTATGALRSEARLDARGFLSEGGVGAPVSSRRVRDDELAADFTPPEIVDSSAVAIGGDAPDVDGTAGMHLAIAGVKAPPPVLADLPWQTVALGPGGVWDVRVEPVPLSTGTDTYRETAEIRERTDFVSRALKDDLGLAALTPDEALAAGAGDCTAHAVVLQAELERRGYETHLVTGYVIDDGALRRHRWVLVRVGHKLIPVDPMYDQVPASPAHVALAIHGGGADDLAFVDDVVFAGWTGARATIR